MGLNVFVSFLFSIDKIHFIHAWYICENGNGDVKVSTTKKKTFCQTHAFLDPMLEEERKLCSYPKACNTVIMSEFERISVK